MYGSQWNENNNVAYLNFLKEQVVNNDNNSITVFADEYNFRGFTFEELETILDRKRKPSAGGNDGVTYEMIRALPGISKRSLLTSLNNNFMENDIPDDLRIIKVIPVPKPNKDLSDYKNFRPISLISVMLKIINLMVKEHINQFLCI